MSINIGDKVLITLRTLIRQLADSEHRNEFADMSADARRARLYELADRAAQVVTSAPQPPAEAQAALSCVTVEIDADTGKITGTRREPLFTRPAEAQPAAAKLLSEGGAGCHDCDGYQAEGVFCPTCGTDHSEPPPSAPVGVEDKAREILADEYRQAGFYGAADDALADEPSPHCKVTIKAIERALTQQPAAVDGGKVAVRESKLRYCIRELNGARQGDTPQQRAEIVHGVLTAALAALQPDAAATHRGLLSDELERGVVAASTDTPAARWLKEAQLMAGAASDYLDRVPTHDDEQSDGIALAQNALRQSLNALARLAPDSLEAGQSEQTAAVDGEDRRDATVVAGGQGWPHPGTREARG